ncbi:MAG TPA: DUF4340 domain-containing protein [Planctomycetota bacterium]|nr:DUF4340 domain-containing protein [Planctomycetota bacterium]
MSSRTVVALVLVAVLGGVAAWLAGGSRATPDAATGVDAPLIAGLSERVNDVASISVLAKDEHFTVRKDGGTWKVVEHGNYPANFELVKKTLMGLVAMKTLEAKTGNPDLYKKIGVEDPEQPGADSALVTLLDANGQAMGAVILGHNGTLPNTLYARRPSESQSWLVHGDLFLEKRSSQWIDKEGWKLPADRVKSVTTDHADGETLHSARDAETDAAITVRDVPEGMQPKSTSVGRMQQSALDPLPFDDVAPAASFTLPANDRCTTTFDTFDGLHVVVTSAVEDMASAPVPEGGETPKPRIWATVEVTAAADASDAVKAEAEKAAAELSPWVFALQEWRAGGLRRRMNELVQPIPPPKADETPAAPTEGAAPAAPEPGSTADQPPAEPPPADQPPAETPPAETPPATEPPATEPPKGDGN